MAKFIKAHKFVERAEGGYTDNPNDNGNWTGGKKGSGDLIGTNYGISAPVLKAYLGRTPSVADMKNLKKSTAEKIYKKNYWDANNLGLIQNDSIALLIYDGAVNQGSYAMKDSVAKAFVSIGKSGVTTNNALTKGGVQRINQTAPKRLFEAIKDQREARYKRSSSAKYFLKGWLKRLNSIDFQTGVFWKDHWGKIILGSSLVLGGGLILFGTYKK